jgi:hypothetical protein
MPGNVSTKKRTSAASAVPPPQLQAGGGDVSLKPPSQPQQPQPQQPQQQQSQSQSQQLQQQQQQHSQFKSPEQQARGDDAALPPQRATSAPAASMGLSKTKEGFITEEFSFSRAPQAIVVQVNKNPPPRSAQKEFDFKSLAFCLPVSMIGQAYSFISANRAEDEEEKQKVRALPTSSAFMAQSFRFV